MLEKELRGGELLIHKAIFSKMETLVIFKELKEELRLFVC